MKHRSQHVHVPSKKSWMMVAYLRWWVWFWLQSSWFLLPDVLGFPSGQWLHSQLPGRSPLKDDVELHWYDFSNEDRCTGKCIADSSYRQMQTHTYPNCIKQFGSYVPILCSTIPIASYNGGKVWVWLIKTSIARHTPYQILVQKVGNYWRFDPYNVLTYTVIQWTFQYIQGIFWG